MTYNKTNACACEACQGIHTVSYEPGQCEAVIQCQVCGQLWYSLLFERMHFAGDADTLDEYQIPITAAEYQQIVATPDTNVSLAFLRGRRARVRYAGGMAEVTSDVALGRSGRA